MPRENELRRCAPETLSSARAIGHKAAQFATKAARANLPAEPDDSQSNLGWDGSLNGFLSQPLGSQGAPYFVGVLLSPLKLTFVKGDQPVAALDLGNVSESAAAEWLDTQLEQVGLKPSSAVTLPYELPPEVAEIETFHSGAEAATLTALAAWFDLAHSLLSEFAAGKASMSPGPSPVRCWPHHFDIATYVGLEVGDFETAKGIGVGMSPGDESYDQPYFYINPWPHLDPKELPDPPAPGHWHTDGFVGAIATAQEVLSLSDIAGKLPLFLERGFAIGHEKIAG